jgi:hypothetical protein
MRVREEASDLGSTYFAHSVEHVEMIVIYEARCIQGEDGREWCSVCIARIENRKSVYFITDKMNMVPLAKSHEGFQCLFRVTLPFVVIRVPVDIQVSLEH